MAGLGFILGGALQGAGKGLMQQQIVEDQRRRDEALASLRAQNERDRQDHQAEIDAEDDRRDLQSKLTQMDAAAGIANEQRASENQFKSEEARREHQRAVAMEVLKHKDRIAEDAYNAATAARQRLGEPLDIVTDDDGNSTMVFKGGETVKLGKIGRRTKTSGSDSITSVTDTSGGSDVSTSTPARRTMTRSELMEKAKAAGLDETEALAWARRKNIDIR